MTSKGVGGRPVGIITTDVAHRRFEQKKSEHESGGFVAPYSCQECKSQFNDSSSLEEHFDRVKHNNSKICIYCSKPAYYYVYKGEKRVYHSC